MSNHERGVIYIVTTHKSDKYLRAAVASARSVATHSPGIGIHMCTDAAGLAQLASMSGLPAMSTAEIQNPHYRSKVDYIMQTPFERTLYLDSDTRVVADIRDMFDVLDRFDMALTHAHRRNHTFTNETWQVPIPHAFPQYNGGVILYKKIPTVTALLDAWGETFHTAGFRKDQVTLRELLWTSDIRLATLPPEYNVRYAKYLWIWNKLEAQAKILHMNKFHNPGLKATIIRHIRSFKKLVYAKRAT